jgi:hypothetical protein
VTSQREYLLWSDCGVAPPAVIVLVRDMMSAILAYPTSFA